MAPTWDPDVYLRFAAQRERPFDELVARIGVADPATVVDLGCGPGTATARLAERWERARVLGVDSSPEMIARALGRAVAGRLDFRLGDVRTWRAEEPVDVIVSNAALQWVPGHADLFPRLVDQLAPGGVFAFQVPANFDEPIHTELRGLVASGRWDIPTDGLLGDRPVLEPVEYLRRLHALGMEADVWETTYLQVLQGPDAVLEWARGTALRPVLDALDPDQAAELEAAYGARLRAVYPTDTAGRSVLGYRRTFAVARRGQ